MSAKFILATDSGCDLSYGYCREKDIYTVHMKYLCGDTAFTDNMIDAETREFYNKMRNGTVFKTSQINYDEYTTFFEGLIEKNLPIIYIALGSKVSGSYDNAAKAASDINEKYPNAKVYACDSTLASLGIGMFVLQITEMRDRGMSAEECVKWIEINRTKVNTFYTTNTLTYLTRGGRISKMSAFFGGILNINPIMKLDTEGHMLVCDKAIGKKNAIKKIIGNMLKIVENPEQQTVYISHADALEKAQELGEELKAKIGFKDVFYSYIGTIVGTHTGPGLRAIFFLGKDRT